MTSRIRTRRTRDRRSDHFLPIEDEVRGPIRQADYVWHLTPFLHPRRDESPEDRRRMIETARKHELEMFRLFPDGPDRPRRSRPSEDER